MEMIMTKKDAFDIYKEDNREDKERVFDDLLATILIIPIVAIIIYVIVAR